MILGFKQPPGDDEYWYGKINGQDLKFKRVIAGIILPVFDRANGAVVVIGEKFERTTTTQSFVGLDAAVGPLPAIEQALREFDKRLQFRDAIMPTDGERKLLWKIPGLSLHILTWYAPDWATGEIGRQKVDQLGTEKRINIDMIRAILSQDPETSAKALQVAVGYALDWNPPYKSKEVKQPVYGRILGTDGL